MCPDVPTSAQPQPNPSMLGFGLGLRTPHFEQILSDSPEVDFFEIVSENFMVAGGKPHYYLNAIGERYPLVMHGVSLSIGSVDPLNWEYLQQLRYLSNKVQPAWLSDHLCFTGIAGVNSHDLLPLPYTEEALTHVANRVRQVQDYLQRPLVLENVSTYLEYRDSSLREWEFLNHLANDTGCEILLDINNIYVSARNHGFDPEDFLCGIEPHHIRQIHLAGHTDNGDHLIDTHDQPIAAAVFSLYASALRRFGPISTLLERDDNIPPLSELIAELNSIRLIAKQSLSQGRTHVVTF
ncbi:MAG: DUF692 domain-containing protein [Gammaproteobacteria bacterium]|nr:DUF692 domain-containing protein [Gammaproteobacteria bacterium]